MALASTLLSNGSPDALTVVDHISSRLEPYEAETSYGIFDAFIILLREGMEALLVVVALLAFLKRSGNGSKQGWIWMGAGVGLAASIGLAFILQAVFSRAVNPNNRELLEGVTGLVAAVMLVYVSYWMHSKSSAQAWTKYIAQRTTAALATGSLFGLALLSFLAIFREGAETALFYLGIAPAIKTSDLFIGLAAAVVVLGVIGFLMVVAGVRIPVTKFMAVASILVFFLCFKFVGAGIHSLQVSGIAPATAESYLPSSDFLGLFPTWQTVIPQLVLLALAITVVVHGRLSERITNQQPPLTTAPAAS
jgi:high-affinity iron transporter